VDTSSTPAKDYNFKIMTTENLTSLLHLYKKALAKKLTILEFQKSLQDARIELDKSFVQNSKNDTDLEDYINELLELQQIKFST